MWRSGPSHSGYSPRRAIMGNRHIPIETPNSLSVFKERKTEKECECLGQASVRLAAAAALVQEGSAIKVCPAGEAGAAQAVSSTPPPPPPFFFFFFYQRRWQGFGIQTLQAIKLFSQAFYF